MSFRLTRARFITALVASVCITSNSFAIAYTWFGPGGSATAPTSGNWSLTSNWLGGTPASANTSTLNFGGTTDYNANNDLAALSVINKMLFTGSGSIGITGNQLRLSGTNPGIDQGGSGTVNITTNIQGDGTIIFFTGAGSGAVLYQGIISDRNAGNPSGLTKSGTYDLTLFGNNSYSLATTINAGTLRLGNSGVVPDGSAVTVANVATFDVNGKTETIGSLAGGGSVTLGANGALTAGGDNTSTSYSGVMSGSGTFTKAGSGVVTFVKVNTYTGTTIVSAGSLRFGIDNALDSTSNVVVNGGSLDLNGHALTIATLSGTGGTVAIGAGTLDAYGDNSSGTYAGAVTGTGTFNKDGTGVATLSGAGSSINNVLINDGTLRLGANGVFTNAANINIASTAVFDVNTRTVTIGALTGTGSVTTGTNGVLTAGATPSWTYDGVISGAGGFTKAGSGVATFTSAQTYTGATTVNVGTLRLASSERLADTTAVSVTGTLDLANNTETVSSIAGAGSITLGSGTLIAGDTSSNFTGVISGTGGTFVKTGVGSLNLAGANSYTGPTFINGGNLRLGASNVLSDSTAVTIAASATLALANNITDTIGSLAGAGSVAFGNAGSALTAGFDDTSTTFSGVISGNGFFTKIGNGVATFSGANTYTGATNINAGILREGANNVLSDSTAVTVAGGATFDLNGNTDTIGSLAGAGTTDLGATGALTWGANTSATYSGVMIGAGSFSKNGTGVATFSGASTYTGATNINNGQLVMGASNVLSNSTDVTVAAPATFDLNGTSQTIGSLAGAGSVVLGAGALTAGGDDASTTYSGNMSGVGGVFLKAGNGVATFSGSNSYTGATFINHGTLRLGADDVLSDSTAVHIAPVATFDVNGHSDTIGALSGAGSVTLGSGSLTSGADNSSAGYPGIMSGAGGSYTKAGLGVATFNNVHTYDGLTHITGGTLFLAGTGSIVSSVKVEAGSTFDVSDFGATGFTVAPGKTLSGGGTVAGKTIITNTATVSPGSSPGALSLGDQEWGQGGTYVWEVNDATGTAGTGFDQLQLSGALAVTSTSGNTFTIDVRSLTAGNTPGDAQNFDKTQNYSWIIASTSAPVSIDPAVVTILTTGFTNDITATNDPGAQNGAFTITADGDNVLLNYSAAPEPASTALLALTLTATLTRRPRRRVAIGA